MLLFSLVTMILLGLYIANLELTCSDLQKRLEAKEEELKAKNNELLTKTSQMEALSIKIEDVEDQLTVKQRFETV